MVYRFYYMALFHSQTRHHMIKDFTQRVRFNKYHNTGTFIHHYHQCHVLFRSCSCLYIDLGYLIINMQLVFLHFLYILGNFLPCKGFDLQWKFCRYVFKQNIILFATFPWHLPVLGWVGLCFCGFMSRSTQRVNQQWFWFKSLSKDQAKA